jgi:predicted aspartyl protease
MKKYSFQFRKVTASSPARPYIPVTISNPHGDNAISVFALVDTGADECALPASFAPLLGHHLEKGLIKKIGTGNGTTVAYAHKSRIVMSDFSTGDILIDYMPNLQTPLLGVKSFLGRFVVSIDYPSFKFTLSLAQD